ncbi:hypothetical protein ACJ73_08155, partial [Blastomyces percursus]
NLMVNLRSGGTPDLTRDYAPTRRRNPETPEAQGSNAGFPTPATDRRTAAPGAFELDETIDEESNDSNESNNDFQDPVDDDAMSDNAGGPSGRDSASEEIRMRLEIASLQHEVERMKASRASEALASDDDVSADLAEFLQRQGRTSALMRILGEFRDQVRPIKKPVVLTGSVNYPRWKGEILLAARQSRTIDIMDEKQLGPKENASQDMQRFWEERNMWLYNYMWSAITPQAKSHFIIPKDSELSAYALWAII